jgi:hypothetical protein
MANSYNLALADARDELVYAHADEKRISLRISQLEAVIAQLEAIIATSAPASAPLFDAVKEPVEATKPTTSESAQVPLWKAIVAAMNGSKADFTVPMAYNALRRTGRNIESPNRLNIIRNTLIHKDEVFGRLEHGHYFVRGFENATQQKNLEDLSN